MVRARRRTSSCDRRAIHRNAPRLRIFGSFASLSHSLSNSLSLSLYLPCAPLIAAYCCFAAAALLLLYCAGQPDCNRETMRERTSGNEGGGPGGAGSVSSFGFFVNVFLSWWYKSTNTKRRWWPWWSRQRQNLCFCTSSCVSISTFVLANLEQDLMTCGTSRPVSVFVLVY